MGDSLENVPRLKAWPIVKLPKNGKGRPCFLVSYAAQIDQSANKNEEMVEENNENMLIFLHVYCGTMTKKIKTKSKEENRLWK